MVLLIGKLVGVACLFGLAIRVFPEMSFGLTIVMLVALYWAARRHARAAGVASNATSSPLDQGGTAPTTPPDTSREPSK